MVTCTTTCRDSFYTRIGFFHLGEGGGYWCYPGPCSNGLHKVRLRGVMQGFVKFHKKFEFFEFIVPHRYVVCTVKPVVMALVLDALPPPYTHLWFWGPVYNFERKIQTTWDAEAGDY